MKTQVVFLTTFLLSVLTICAQDKKERKFFEEGVILSSPNTIFDDVSYDISKEPVDPYLIGVATGSRQPKKWSDFICSAGTSNVKYNSENGPIKKGDLITSSSIPGVGMKATQTGMVVGMALEDSKGESGLIKCRIMIQYVKQ